MTKAVASAAASVAAGVAVTVPKATKAEPLVAAKPAAETAARAVAEGAGLDVDYRESEAGHSIDPGDIPRAIDWLRETIGR